MKTFADFVDQVPTNLALSAFAEEMRHAPAINNEWSEGDIVIVCRKEKRASWGFVKFDVPEQDLGMAAAAFTRMFMLQPHASKSLIPAIHVLLPISSSRFFSSLVLYYVCQCR